MFLYHSKNYLKNESDFCFTYGDGLADIDLKKLIKYHKSHGKLATLTAVSPPARFGALDLKGDDVQDFKEKPSGQFGMVNGGFFVLSNKVLDFIEGDKTSWEINYDTYEWSSLFYLSTARSIRIHHHSTLVWLVEARGCVLSVWREPTLHHHFSMLRYLFLILIITHDVLLAALIQLVAVIPRQLIRIDH